MRGNKGITLIALVITIIVLLILAGISISMITGNNSILTNASKTPEYNKISIAQDRIAIKIQEYTLSYFIATYRNDGSYIGTTLPADTLGAISDAVTFINTGNNKTELRN